MYSQNDYYDPEYDDYPPQEPYDEYGGQNNYYTANKIPDGVKTFLLFLYESIENGNVYNIQNLYENTFPKLSETYFEKKEWPDEKDVSELVEKNGKC